MYNTILFLHHQCLERISRANDEAISRASSKAWSLPETEHDHPDEAVLSSTKRAPFFGSSIFQTKQHLCIETDQHQYKPSQREKQETLGTLPSMWTCSYYLVGRPNHLQRICFVRCFRWFLVGLFPFRSKGSGPCFLPGNPAALSGVVPDRLAT